MRFIWPDFWRSIWKRSVGISVAALGTFSGLDFLAAHFSLGIPTLSEHSPLGLAWFIALLVLIVAVAIYAELFEQVGAIPSQILLAKKRVSLTSIATCVVLIAGIIVIYTGSYLTRPQVSMVAAPTVVFEWSRHQGADAGVAAFGMYAGKPVVNIWYTNTGETTGKIRFFYQIRTAPTHTMGGDSPDPRTIEEFANLRALVKSDIAEHPDPGFHNFIPGDQMATLAGERLSSAEGSRVRDGYDMIYFVIYAAVNMPGSDRVLSPELCGSRDVGYATSESC